MNDVEWVRQYVAFAEPQLERIIVGAKLHAALTNVIRGPMTLTFQIRLQPHCLSKQNLDRVLGLGDVIASALDAEAVRMQRDSGTINIEVPLPPTVCVTPPGIQLARHTKDTNICVGIDSYKQPVFLDLRQHGAILWVGPTRSGKTQSMKSILYAMLRNGEPIQFAILSQKIEDWEPFVNLEACLGLASHADEVLAVAAWAEALLDERARTKQKTPRTILITDDLINLLKIAPDMGSAMGAIASMGAGLGMHLMIGTQEAGSKRGTGDTSVENNVTAKIMYRIANAQAAARSAGQGGIGLHNLSGTKGDAIFVCHNDKKRIATGYLQDEWLHKLPQATVVPAVAPWLRPTRTTGKNQSQPPETSCNRPVVEMEGVTREGYATPIDTPTPQQRTQPVVATTPVFPEFPVARRPLTDQEAAVVQEMFGAGQSQNSIIEEVYGNKDGKTMLWIKEAKERNLSSINTANIAADDQQPTSATLAALLKAGTINWNETIKVNQH